MKSGAHEFVPFARAGSLYAHMKSSMTRAEWKMRARDLMRAAFLHPTQNILVVRALLATRSYNWTTRDLGTRNPQVTELFLAAGLLHHTSFANLQANPDYTEACARVMIANGYRTNKWRNWPFANAQDVALLPFQYGIRRCRRAVIALWILRKRGVNLDKFLAREMALAVWTTRWDWAK